MFEQYHALKAAHPDAILFFRMGDFFEMFFEDAELAAKALELTLTSRNRNDPVPIPMAGVPHHSAASYIQRLVELGHKVAIAEQTEDPSQAKGLVRREVIRVVTPGVVFDPATLAGHQANWLVAIARGVEGYGLAFFEVSTGDLRTTLASQPATAVNELQRLSPREVLLSPEVSLVQLQPGLIGTTLSVVEAALWELEGAKKEISNVLAAPGGIEAPAVCLQAVGAVLRYAREKLGAPLRNVHQVNVYRADAFLVVDEATRRNLELFRTMMEGKRQGSLASVLDEAVTPMGSRRIGDWLSFPLLDPEAIAERSAAVERLVEESRIREELRRVLRQVSDIERIVARVGQGSAHARDLCALGRSLAVLPELCALLEPVPELAWHAPPDLCADLVSDIEATLVDDPPLALTEGGLIRSGVHTELDELVGLANDGMSIIDRMEEEERKATGITSLKIRHNKVFGYFIEITTANVHRVPNDRYMRKQTLSNCERYITSELKELETKVLGADSRRKELELELFRELRDRVMKQSRRLNAAARAVSSIDALCALAEVAVRWRWTRPEVDESRSLEIVGGRHPMVELALLQSKEGAERFVPNDVSLDPVGAGPARRSMIVLTGPNMAGKSTVLRQVALITLLAHIGSFVPAERARIGLCDRIFSRVGAADDLRRGQSTFMVEMSETALILHQATDRSLVVLDEIGRGTSTYDGIAIAWAVAEDLHDRIGCRALFATHYHELCELAQSAPRVANQHVAVSDSGGEIAFLRKLQDGGASRSYGIQCAKLAGLPVPVVERARKLLSRYEKAVPPERRQLALFAGTETETVPGTAPEPTPVPEPTPPPADKLREKLSALKPDDMSPREALTALYALRDLL
jgi:DNA mismatch repair protein MutS